MPTGLTGLVDPTTKEDVLKLNAWPMQGHRWGNASLPPGTVIYEVYPRSFQATKGLTGDINGITQRLPHLVGLGVDYIWLSPIFTSPMRDFGYDVSDYCGVDPLFGTLDDLKRLIDKAASYGMRIMGDLVVNHTSNLHPWFQLSRSSRTSPKRDWYIWRDATPDGGTPNNWLSVFGGSAWSFDWLTGQYYMHSFLPQQPDLNWKNPEVQETMQNVLHYWANLGICHWRVDAADWTGKDLDDFCDNPLNPDYVPGPGSDPYHQQIQIYTKRMPSHYGYLRILADTLREYNGAMIVETYPPGPNFARDYQEIYTNFPDNAAPLLLTPLIYRPFNAESLQLVHQILADLKPGAAPVWVTGTHDVSRVVSRLPDPRAARLAAMLLFLLPGISVIYYGEEIGMEDGTIRPDQVQDPFALGGITRDICRTPMQWTPSKFAGFSTIKPWLPIPDSHAQINVNSQRGDERSMLAFYERLLAFKKRTPAFRDGDYEPLNVSQNVFGFVRCAQGERYEVLLNVSDASVRCEIESGGSIVLDTHGPAQGRIDSVLELRPWEGVIILQ